MPFNHGAGNQSCTCALAEYGTASGLVHPQPKLSPQFATFLGLGGVASGEDFSPVVAGGTWTCELKIHSQVV